MNAKQVPLGTVSGLYGVQGWVKVFSETAPRENIFQYQPWVVTKPQTKMVANVLNWRRQGKTLIAKLEGVDSRESARTLIGSTISVAADQFPTLGDEEYYWHQLVGCRVIQIVGPPDGNGPDSVPEREIGTLIHFMETGANDVMVVETKNGEHLIPWIPGQVVQRVDLDIKVIRVDWDPDY